MYILFSKSVPPKEDLVTFLIALHFGKFPGLRKIPAHPAFFLEKQKIFEGKRSSMEMAVK